MLSRHLRLSSVAHHDCLGVGISGVFLCSSFPSTVDDFQDVGEGEREGVIAAIDTGFVTTGPIPRVIFTGADQDEGLTWRIADGTSGIEPDSLYF